jgi:hypothetical protein
MGGQIKSLIDTIVEKRAGGDPLLERTTKTKLMLKGINVWKYSADSEDEPEVIERLKVIAKEIGINL